MDAQRGIHLANRNQRIRVSIGIPGLFQFQKRRVENVEQRFQGQLPIRRPTWRNPLHTDKIVVLSLALVVRQSSATSAAPAQLPEPRQ